MRTTWTHKYTQWAERNICCRILIIHNPAEGLQNDICFVHRLVTDWPSSCAACHRSSVTIRQLISNQHPQLIKWPSTGLHYCYVCRQTLEMTSPTSDRLPRLNSFSVTPERLGALHLPPQYSTLRTVSYRRRCSTNQQQTNSVDRQPDTVLETTGDFS